MCAKDGHENASQHAPIRRKTSADRAGSEVKQNRSETAKAVADLPVQGMPPHPDPYGVAAVLLAMGDLHTQPGKISQGGKSPSAATARA